MTDVENNNRNHTKPITLPRLVPRNLPFNQSHSTVEVKHNQGLSIWNLARHDMFHIMLRMPSYVSLTIFLTIWTCTILVFAGLYMAVDRNDPNISCGLGLAGIPIEFYGAFAFSLETCTTVGYGLPSSVNAFFSNCPSLQLVIFIQMIWSMIFNAFLFAFFYSRIARSEVRAVQVIFSDKAIVSLTAGQVRFQMRVYDVDAKHPVVDAHVRLYAVKKTKNQQQPQQLRLIQPNDELNSMLFLSFPTVVAHHIDLYSILHPPQQGVYPPPVNPCGLVLRQADSITSSREEVVCPVCGESYGTFERWVSHVRYQRISETIDEMDNLGMNNHHAIADEHLKPQSSASCTDLDALREYFREEIAEVLIVVEGIDPLMSGTFQALQSYRFEDIVWNNAAAFHPCIAVDKTQKLRVDLDRFHDVDLPQMSLTDSRRPSFRIHDSFVASSSPDDKSDDREG